MVDDPTRPAAGDHGADLERRLREQAPAWRARPAPFLAERIIAALPERVAASAPRPRRMPAWTWAAAAALLAIVVGAVTVMRAPSAPAPDVAVIPAPAPGLPSIPSIPSISDADATSALVAVGADAPAAPLREEWRHLGADAAGVAAFVLDRLPVDIVAVR